MTTRRHSAWQGRGLDFSGFLLGLLLAWSLQWRITDLVWGLWLSSLVLGYATLLIGIGSAGRRHAGRSGSVVMVAGLAVGMVLFFTVHFGMFHFVHSVFLNLFFPVRGGAVGFWLGPSGYAAIVDDYWPWLAAAALAERQALREAWTGMTAMPLVAGPNAPAGFNPFGPYKNVLRMHVLIFVFAGAFFAGLDHFALYALVYAAYFWPWRRPLLPTTGATD